MKTLLITSDIKTWLKWLTTDQSIPKKKGVPFKKDEFLHTSAVVVADYRKEKKI